jgi:hypothetical protein
MIRSTSFADESHGCGTGERIFHASAWADEHNGADADDNWEFWSTKPDFLSTKHTVMDAKRRQALRLPYNGCIAMGCQLPF